MYLHVFYIAQNVIRRVFRDRSQQTSHTSILHGSLQANQLDVGPYSSDVSERPHCHRVHYRHGMVPTWVWWLTRCFW